MKIVSLVKKVVKKIIRFGTQKTNQERTSSSIQFERCKPWFAVHGDQTLRLNYDLNPDSLVFDLGGFKGEFAADIYNKYQSNIFIFEPVSRFYEIIVNTFMGNEKVRVFKYGLASEDGFFDISDSDNSSSIFIKSEKSERIELKSISSFLTENHIEKVDLIKINIEGGEYDVLESLLQENKIQLFQNIQVQFHDFIIENASERMHAIQKELAKTHELTYQFEFVWENWKIK